MKNHKTYSDLMQSKPVHGTERELSIWRRRVRVFEEQAATRHRQWVEHIQSQWEKEEWEAIRAQLEKLTLRELCEITGRVGIAFTIGNERIRRKIEFILVLDEAEKSDLYRAYRRVTGRDFRKVS